MLIVREGTLRTYTIRSTNPGTQAQMRLDLFCEDVERFHRDLAESAAFLKKHGPVIKTHDMSCETCRKG